MDTFFAKTASTLGRDDARRTTPEARMYEALMAETIRHEGAGGDEIESYYARPLGPGPYPGVVVFHHNPGWDEATKEITRKFAHHGYIAICPHLFHRHASEGMTPLEASNAAGGAASVPEGDWLADAAGAIAYIRSQLYSSGKVGVIGYCSGGRQAFIAACRLPVDASVDCYGGQVVVTPDQLTSERPVAPLDMTPDMVCPILCLFGEDDPRPPIGDRDVIEAALKANNKEFETHSYENTGHAFFSTDQPAYRVAAANDGWERIFRFFGQHLAGGS